MERWTPHNSMWESPGDQEDKEEERTPCGKREEKGEGDGSDGSLTKGSRGSKTYAKGKFPLRDEPWDESKTGTRGTIPRSSETRRGSERSSHGHKHRNKRWGVCKYVTPGRIEGPKKGGGESRRGLINGASWCASPDLT